jgi:hypothetical protein
MKKTNKYLFSFFILLLFQFSCTKKIEEKSDLDKLRSSNNKKTYPATKMDSLQAIQFITKQKIQDLYDLSALYTSGTKDTEIDSVIYQQMMGYFTEPDSAKVASTLKEMDSLKVKDAKIGDIQVSKEIIGKDTMDLAKFQVEYFDAYKRKIGSYSKTVSYELKTTPVKFKKEFKFYFVNFNMKPQKDSTSLGNTK